MKSLNTKQIKNISGGITMPGFIKNLSPTKKAQGAHIVTYAVAGFALDTTKTILTWDWDNWSPGWSTIMGAGFGAISIVKPYEASRSEPATTSAPANQPGHGNPTTF